MSTSGSPVDPILFIEQSAGSMELTLDAIVSMQQGANRKVETVAFVSKNCIEEADLLHSIVFK